MTILSNTCVRTEIYSVLKHNQLKMKLTINIFFNDAFKNWTKKYSSKNAVYFWHGISNVRTKGAQWFRLVKVSVNFYVVLALFFSQKISPLINRFQYWRQLSSQVSFSIFFTSFFKRWWVVHIIFLENTPPMYNYVLQMPFPKWLNNNNNNCNFHIALL